MLLEVIEDLPDGVGVFHGRYDPHRTAVVRAGLHVDAEHALEALRPRHRGAFLGRRAVVGDFAILISTRACVGLFATTRRRKLRAQVGIRRKDAAEARQVRALIQLGKVCSGEGACR